MTLLPNAKRRFSAFVRIVGERGSNPKGHYTDCINNHESWVLAGIYSEQASGTCFDNGAAFNSMMKDCHAGKIDYIITKSISRFGRKSKLSGSFIIYI